ncbi:MAG: ABC transporter substrate-binding protein, partial [Ruminococcus sp.]|nr:ABC transporter substrate-binding protein [Ruminococcus sp.]
MNKKIAFISILAALSLTTGCAGLNNSSSSKEKSTSAATTGASTTTDCCEGSTGDCCKNSEPADCCGDSAEAVLGKPEKTDISIGYLNSTAHLLAFVAEEEGYFEEEGLDVDLVQFSSASELINGLESDKLDVAFIGSVPTLTFQSQGHEVS